MTFSCRNPIDFKSWNRPTLTLAILTLKRHRNSHQSGCRGVMGWVGEVNSILLGSTSTTLGWGTINCRRFGANIDIIISFLLIMSSQHPFYSNNNELQLSGVLFFAVWSVVPVWILVVVFAIFVRNSSLVTFEQWNLFYSFRYHFLLL